MEGGGQRRAQRPKVDSNEVLRKFHSNGWAPADPLDAQSVDQGILDALGASQRPRGETEQHARQLCAFVFENLELAAVSMVDIFSANLWQTVVDPEWAAELMALSDEVPTPRSTPWPGYFSHRPTAHTAPLRLHFSSLLGRAAARRAAAKRC